MGESRSWPTKGSGSGLLDFAGFEKPSYQMFKTLWNEDAHIHITTQRLDKSPYKQTADGKVVEKQEGWTKRQLWGWQNVNEHWNYNEGDEIVVEVYTNTPQVLLYVEGESMGAKKLEDFEDHIIKYVVPYKKGLIKAVGMGSDTIVRNKIETAGSAHRISLSLDKADLKADAYDVVHIVAQVVDADGVPVKHHDFELNFDVKGDVRILGVDNGSPQNIQDIQSNKIKTSKGHCLMIVQSTLKTGVVKISASSETFGSNTLELNIN